MINLQHATRQGRRQFFVAGGSKFLLKGMKARRRRTIFWLVNHRKREFKLAFDEITSFALVSKVDNFILETICLAPVFCIRPYGRAGLIIGSLIVSYF